MRSVGAVLLAAIFVASCGSTGEQTTAKGEQDSSKESLAPSGERVAIGETEALVWGDGDYGAVMAHGASYDAASWEEQGQEIAEEGLLALAPEDTSPESLLASIEYLKEERGIQDVAFIGGSAGGNAVLRAAGRSPGAAHQLILLSSAGDVSGLGEEPKLFVASEGEGLAEEARRMAREAPGDQNEALILPGDAHAQAIFQTEEGDRLMRAILERLKEYR